MDLRPLTLAELLDRSFSTYKQHLWLFVGIMAVPAVWGMVSAIGLQFFGGAVAPGVDPQVAIRKSVILLVWSLTFGVVYLFIYAFALGATTIAVSQLYLLRPTSVGATYRAVRPHAARLVSLLLSGWLRLSLAFIGVLLGAGILAAVAAIASPVLSVILGFTAVVAGFAVSLYMIVLWGVAVPALVLEDLSAGKSLARSVELTEDHRGRVSLVILCAIVITYATALLVQIPFVAGAVMAGPGTPLSIALNIVGAVLGGIGGMFSGPIMIIGLAMMYYDLRIRKEALDLQMMLERLDTPSGS